MNNSVDWTAIKAEYIAGGIGYRKLAEKYGVSFSTLSQLAMREKWTDLRKKASDKADTELAKTIGKRNAKKSVKIDRLVDMLLDRIAERMDALIVEGKDVKSIASALKDIRDLKGIKDELDEKEQKARIRKLEKEAQPEERQDNEIKVTIECGLDEYSK